jgi:SAM-dependent methyltransferase
VPRFAELDWYETPLYYDIVFAGDDEREGRFLRELVARYGRVARARARLKVLEPACGSGRMVLEMAREGCDVTGFDASAPMLAFAHERLAKAGLRARLVEGRLESFDAGAGFELAHCMVNTFKYLLDERSARAHLRCVANALAPGGLYAIGVHLTEYADRRRNRERWLARRGRIEVVCNIQGWPADRRTRIERVRSRLSVVERGVVRRLETSWDFRTYDLQQFLALIASVPSLEHVASFDFGYDAFRPRELPDGQLDVVFVLRKRNR